MRVKLNDIIVSAILLTAFIGMFVLFLSFPFSFPSDANLSAETKEIVEDLRWKHYPRYLMDDSTDWIWEQSYPYIKFEDGIFYIVDKDVTWFIEMTKVEEVTP